MLSVDRFTVVLDACSLFPMVVRDVLLTFADHEFYAPKWSARIHEEWTRNLAARFADKSAANDAAPKIAAIRNAMDRTFPDALVTQVLPESGEIFGVDEKDRHVVMTAVAARADAIVTFNLKDFAAEQLESSLRIEVKHPDIFILDLIDLNEKRALAAFRDLRARKRRPPWSVNELLDRLIRAGLVQTSAWLSSSRRAAVVITSASGHDARSRPNHFSRFPSENPFVDRRFAALYDESHLIWREAMTCPTFRCPR